jgi:hydrogenase maturation protein HypF
VFQNALLLRLSRNGLQNIGLQVITHQHVPPNDGGITLGQLLVGTAG